MTASPPGRTGENPCRPPASMHGQSSPYLLLRARTRCGQIFLRSPLFLVKDKIQHTVIDRCRHSRRLEVKIRKRLDARAGQIIAIPGEIIWTERNPQGIDGRFSRIHKLGGRSVQIPLSRIPGDRGSRISLKVAPRGSYR